MMLRQFFSKKWIAATIVVIVAIVVMIRLGVWQLDRLEQRRTFNNQVLSVQDLDVLDLNKAEFAAIEEQVYREAFASGEFDYDHQIVLSNQSYQDQLGVHLLTPMKLANNEEVVLVDRGWVPFDDYLNGNLAQYNQESIQEVSGILANSSTKIGARDCIGEQPESSANLVVWCVDLEGISNQLPYSLSNLYLIRAPAGTDELPPIGTSVRIEISEGPHLGYAVQWFSFAALLALGYPIYFFRTMKAKQKLEQEAEQKSMTPDQNEQILA